MIPRARRGQTVKVIETVGKDIEEALKKGLAELDCRLDDVDVKILEHPGIFRKARVQFTYNDNGGRASIKTKADIMRNLEQRAAKDASENRRDRRQESPDRRDGRRADQANDKRRDGQAPVNAQRRAQTEQAQAAETRKNASDKPSAKPPVADTAQRAPEQARKNEFRNDFRAQLAEANGDVPAQPNKQARNAQKNNAQNDRDQSNAKQQRRGEPNAGDRRQNEKVSAEELEAAAKRADEYLGKLISLMNVKAERECATADGEINVELKTEDATVIGHRGETLDALEYLATIAAATGDDKYVHVNLDCGGYRAKRNEMLIESAIAAAEKAVATGKRVELEPMGSVSRRTVHAVLGNRSDVMTKSEGREPNRYIVIIPRGANNAAGNQGNRNRNNNRKRHKNGNRGQNNRDRKNDEKTE